MKFRALIFTLALTLLISGYAGGTAEANAAITSAAKDSTSQDAAPTLSGNWQLSWTAQNGSARQAMLRIKQEGTKLTGTLEGERGSVPLSGNLQDRQVSFTIKIRRRQANFTGSVDGNKMSGTTEKGAAWTATRQ